MIRGRGDHLIGVVLAVGYVAVLMLTAGDLAMSRDESFYVRAAQDYAGWFELLERNPDVALQRDEIDRAWDYNWEHPALAKTAFALSWLAQKRWHVFRTDSLAFRFPGMVSAGLLLWLIFIWGTRVHGRTAGLFAAFVFALLPRVFYHAHLDCFDIPITLAITATAYCYWRSIAGGLSWKLLLGFVFGLALATKHNSWVMPGIFLIHHVWLGWSDRKFRFPWWLVAMLMMGPVILIGTWPWVWHDTAARLLRYAQFHVSHVHYTTAYFGTSYFRPPFPISYPFVLTILTVPITVSLLFAIGSVRGLWTSRFWRRESARDDPRGTDVLWWGCFLAPLVMIALPTSPIFGGTKHWLTAYPFMALYAGAGFLWTLHALQGRFDERARPAVAWGLGFLLLLPSTLETTHSHPYALSHYGVAAGGVPGAATLGMNRQFWGYTVGELVPWLTEQMPNGGSVWLCDMTPGAWSMLQRDGLVPRNIRVERSMPLADYVLVHHEDHFAEVDFQAWVAFGSVQPARVLTYDGVPIISVYENPRRKRGQ